MAAPALKRLHVKIPPRLLRSLDAWRRGQRDLPTRSEAIRRLVSAGASEKRQRPNRELR